MGYKVTIFLTFVALSAAMLESPSYWLHRGFDITDGELKSFPDYNLQLSTTCNEINLNTGSYDYKGVAMSGYLNIGKGNSALAFLFFGKQSASRDQIKDIPTIIWLNGGPGSSSQLGNLFELGPFQISESSSKAYNITRNKWTWTQAYNILFVDQPAGTGLSYADPTYSKAYVTSQEELATDFYAALKELYQNTNGCFNKLGITGSSPLFVFGESYGGKYAPAIGYKILTEAKDNKGFLTGLKGIAIGDGFTAPFSTLRNMGEYAYNFGLLDYQERAKIEQFILNATYQNMNQRYKDLHVSFYQVLESISNSTNVNVYDMTKYRPYPTGLLDTYFESEQVNNMYKWDKNVKFNSQGGNVREALYEDFMKSEVGTVQAILSNFNIKVLIYTGQNDIIVDTPGTLAWVEEMRYPGADQFRNTLLTPWKINNQVKGFYKKVGKLELRTINNGGHLIPMDQGEVALNMLNGFVQSAMTTADRKIEIQ